MLVLLVSASEASGRPNILLIQTDDQRKVGTMQYMPETRRLFAGQGATFLRGFATTPLCCPSRATTYSGRYVHNHGITGNDGTGFNHEATWLADLRADGYFVGLLGKYLNLVGARHSPAEFTRQWSTFDLEDTRIAAAYTRDFLNAAEQQDERPWALALNTASPHSPLGPHRGVQPGRSAAHRSVRAEPKLRRVRPLRQAPEPAALPGPGLARASRPGGLGIRQGQITEVQAVDEMVQRVFQDLGVRGETNETFAIFISDNGFFWGEHSLTGKERPYDEAVRIPFYARWPGVFARGTSDVIWSRTWISRQRSTKRRRSPQATYSTGGLSWSPTERSWLLNEGFGPPYDGTSIEVPSSVSYFDGRRRYIRWENGFVEDYDHAQDPYELQASNVPDPEIENKLDRAVACVGESCP